MYEHYEDYAIFFVIMIQKNIMSKSIGQRAAEYATQLVGGRYTKGHLGELWQDLRFKYIEIATEQKSIDDEEYSKDMRYIGVKREELIDQVIDTTVQYLNDHLIDVVLVGEDKQSGAWGYRILDERIKDEVKKRLK